MDQYERERLLVRTMRGKREAAKNHKWNGGWVPFGYYVDGGTLLINEKEAAVVRRVFKLASEGMAGSAICDLFNREKIPTPAAMRGSLRAGKEWWPTPIYQMLRDEAYIGRWHFKDITVQVPAIIDADVFEVVQKTWASRAYLTGKNRRHAYPLVGLLYCAECGIRLHGEVAGRDQRFYSHRLEKTRSNRRHSWNAERLEEAVYAEAHQAVKNPTAIAELVKRQTSTFGERDEVLLRLTTIEDQIAKLPSSRERLIDAYQEGTIGKPEWKQRLQELADRKMQLEAERDSLRAQLGQQSIDEASAKKVVDLLRYGPWIEAAGVHALFRQIKVGRDGSMQFDGLLPMGMGVESGLPQ